MVSFIFQNDSLESEDHSCSAELDNAVLAELYRGRRGVVELTGGSVSIPEAALPPIKDTLVLHTAFCISPDAGETMTLLEGSGWPLLLRLRRCLRSGTAWQLSASLRVNGKPRETDCILPLECDRWYELELVLLKGSFNVCIDGKPVGRRVFTGSPTFTCGGGSFCVGGSRQTGEEGFSGWLDNISFTPEPDEEQLRLERSLASSGWMEADSMARDLALEGRSLGRLLETEEPLFTDDPYGPNYYNLYEEGVVIWTAAHKCVRMSLPVFRRYQQLPKLSAAGLPCESEQDCGEGRTLCRLERGSILHDTLSHETSFRPDPAS